MASAEPPQCSAILSPSLLPPGPILPTVPVPPTSDTATSKLTFSTAPSPHTVELRAVTSTPSREDVESLKHMRRECGWDEDKVPKWIEQIGSGDKAVWFIFSAPSLDTSTPTPPTPRSAHEVVGMIALDLSDPLHPEHASLRESKRVRVSSLFVYPKWRGKGYASRAMGKVEELARVKFGAEFATLDTRACHDTWKTYEKMGYREYGTRDRKYAVYFEDPETDHAWAMYMEKDLRVG